MQLSNSASPFNLHVFTIPIRNSNACDWWRQFLTREQYMYEEIQLCFRERIRGGCVENVSIIYCVYFVSQQAPLHSFPFPFSAFRFLLGRLSIFDPSIIRPLRRSSCSGVSFSLPVIKVWLANQFKK